MICGFFHMGKNDFIIISLDGGAGTGKSTTAHSLPSALNLLHVDTGSHYRSMTRAFLNLGLKSDQVNQYLNKNNLNLGTVVDERRSYLLIDEKRFDQTELRTSEINDNVSDFSSIEAVRNLLFDYQRSQVEIARSNHFKGIIMEGRDIGTVILPDAHLKIYLEADSLIRANRRKADGENDQITNRDEKDSSRKIAPLIPANGCIRIDTGLLGIEEVTETLLEVIENLP